MADDVSKYCWAAYKKMIAFVLGRKPNFKVPYMIVTKLHASKVGSTEIPSLRPSPKLGSVLFRHST